MKDPVESAIKDAREYREALGLPEVDTQALMEWVQVTYSRGWEAFVEDMTGWTELLGE